MIFKVGKKPSIYHENEVLKNFNEFPIHNDLSNVPTKFLFPPKKILKVGNRRIISFTYRVHGRRIQIK